MQLIPFESKTLPAHLANRKGGKNAELIANVSASFQVLSIKGKVFALVRGDDRKVIERANADGDMAPAQSVDVVLLRASRELSKVYYINPYEEGSAAAPDCSSAKGDVPDPGVEHPQSKSCATCPHNAWNSGKNGKGKACQDSRRVAVATVTGMQEPMLLRVPPTSLKPLADYASKLDKLGYDFDAVLTRIKFDPNSPTPLLVFEPKGILPAEVYAAVQEAAASEAVEQIVGGTGHAPAKAEAAPAKPAAPKPDPVAAKPAAPKAAPVMDTDLADEVDAIVGEIETAPKAPAPKPKKATPAEKPAAVVADDVDFDAVLAELEE
jgi:hypothetical protein